MFEVFIGYPGLLHLACQEIHARKKRLIRWQLEYAARNSAPQNHSAPGKRPSRKWNGLSTPQLLGAGSSRFLRFARFALRLFLNGESRINPFQIGDRSGIAFALTEFHNPRVTAMAISCTRRDLVEQFFHRILLPQYSKGSAAGV